MDNKYCCSTKNRLPDASWAINWITFDVIQRTASSVRFILLISALFIIFGLQVPVFGHIFFFLIIYQDIFVIMQVMFYIMHLSGFWRSELYFSSFIGAKVSKILPLIGYNAYLFSFIFSFVIGNYHSWSIS